MSVRCTRRECQWVLGCALAALPWLLLGSACQARPATSGRPVVAVTIFPIGDIVSVLVGSAADVAVILPAGASPATFEPPPDLVQRLSGARLVIAVGAGADTWASDLAQSWGAPAVLLTHSMTLKYGNNPHVWLDPVLVRDAILPQLTDALIRIVPGAEARIQANAVEYRDELTRLDGEIRAALSSVGSRAFVATHPAWPYFADRYGLRQVGVLYPSPGRALGPRELGALVGDARRAGVRAVFTEPQLGEEGVLALAEELHARVGTLDPLGGPAVTGHDSYLALLRANAKELARTFGEAHE